MTRSFIQRLPVLLLAMGLVVPAALGQSPEQATDEVESVEASDTELDHVATLLVDIEDVREEYRAQLAETEDVEKAKQIQTEMADAVQETVDSFDDLSVDRYKAIVQAAQSDLDLRKQIMSRVDEERERRDGQNG